jgi:hypothetical protein
VIGLQTLATWMLARRKAVADSRERFSVGNDCELER